LLEKRGKHVNYLVSHGDLVLLEDGYVYLDGWDEWQEGDWKVGERVQRLRARRNGRGNASGNAGVTDKNVQGARLDLLDSAGAGAGAGIALARAPRVRTVQEIRRDQGLPDPLPDDEQRELLEKVAASVKPGILSSATPAITDEELAERYRAIVRDDDEPDWKREAARTQLGLMGLTA
jgi:hypothetical protein